MTKCPMGKNTLDDDLPSPWRCWGAEDPEEVRFLWRLLMGAPPSQTQAGSSSLQPTLWSLQLVPSLIFSNLMKSSRLFLMKGCENNRSKIFRWSLKLPKLFKTTQIFKIIASKLFTCIMYLLHFYYFFIFLKWYGS